MRCYRLWSLRSLILFSLLSSLFIGLQAQVRQAVTWEAYLRQDIDGTVDQLLFVDSLSGALQSVQIDGAQYTPIDEGILYLDRRLNRVMIATVTGGIQPHPFIAIPDDLLQIDWVIGPDQHIAWTLTRGTPDRLRTETYLHDGASTRLILEDGPRSDGVHLLPVALLSDRTTLVMDAGQPFGLAALAPYQQYAGLFTLDLMTGERRELPGEPACFCGAAFRDDLFMRMGLADSGDGYIVNIYDRADGSQVTIDETLAGVFPLAGDLLIAPDGARAIYALSNIEQFGGDAQRVRTAFVLVDLTTMAQRLLATSITTFLHPVRWTDDGQSVIFVSPDERGTWKIRLDTGELERVAMASYLGEIMIR